MHSLSLLNENLLNGGFCSIVLVEIKHPNSNPFLLDFNGIFRVEKNEQSSIMCAFFKLLPSLQLFGLKMSLEQKLSKSLNNKWCWINQNRSHSTSQSRPEKNREPDEKNSHQICYIYRWVWYVHTIQRKFLYIAVMFRYSTKKKNK